jgi:hypothetical protein
MSDSHRTGQAVEAVSSMRIRVNVSDGENVRGHWNQQRMRTEPHFPRFPTPASSRYTNPIFSACFLQSTPAHSL